MKNLIQLSSALIILSFLSCKKDKKIAEPEPTPDPVYGNGYLTLQFTGFTDLDTLVLGKRFKYLNGDSITIDTYKYFISNIVLTKDDNTTFTETESYHVVDYADPLKRKITLNNVPGGIYKSVKFTLGVDSARNKSGSQTGGLDPAGEALDMFWTWNSGYIMIKIDGTSPQSGGANKSLSYHIGGFGGVNKVQRNFTFNFSGTKPTVNTNATPKIYFNSKVGEFFNNPNSLSLATYFYVVGSGPTEKMFADNYADMITFDHIIN